jgi:hypothetical protein
VSEGRLRRGRSDVVLAMLFTLHVALTVVLWFHIRNGPMVGDQAYYEDAAKALSNALRDLGAFHAVDGGELSRSVVGSAWFMPGMPVLLAPLYLVDPHAPHAATLVYFGVVNTLLLGWVVLSVRRVLGRLYAGALLVVPGLAPTWVIFGMTSWGDLTAGLVLTLLVTELVRVYRRSREGDQPGLGEGVRLGLLAIAMVYLRSSTTPLVAVAFGATFLVLVIVRRRNRLRLVGVFAAAAVTFLVVLAPWSLSASESLGARVVTTTSVPDSLANTFGRTDELCYGPCDPASSVWFSPLRYSREVARATGLSEVVVQSRMSAYARQDVTLHSYLQELPTTFSNYFKDPGHFAEVVDNPGATSLQVNLVDRSTNDLIYPAYVLGFLGIVLGLSRRGRTRMPALLVGLCAAALLTQPFVHVSGPRYWATIGPLLGLGVALLVDALRLRYADRSDSRAAPS